MREPRSRSRRRHEPSASSDRWLISYADLVTLLFAFFVVLFSSSQHSSRNVKAVSQSIESGFNNMGVDARPAGRMSNFASPESHQGSHAPPVVSPEETQELLKQLQLVLGSSIAKDEIVVHSTPDGVTISLRELGFFRSGDAKLLPGAIDKLRGTAQVLMQHGLEVRIEGHSDDQPIHNAAFNSNWELSVGRAMSVMSLLVDGIGFNPTKISVAGYGPYRPVADNATADGRKMNRRVDLVIIAAKRDVPPLDQSTPVP